MSRKLLSKKAAAPLQDGDAKELYCYACNRWEESVCVRVHVYMCMCTCACVGVHV